MNKWCLGIECPLVEPESMAGSWILAGTVNLERHVLALGFRAAHPSVMSRGAGVGVPGQSLRGRDGLGL